MAAMKLFLIRHAHAEDGEDDAARPLSAKGRRQIRAMARFLRRSGRLEVTEIWHSPLERARETARLLAEGLHRKVRLREVSGAEPYANAADLVQRCGKVRRPLALVGHEPHLGELATLLLVGRAVAPVIELKKCAVVALERQGRRWVVRWQVSPREIE